MKKILLIIICFLSNHSAWSQQKITDWQKPILERMEFMYAVEAQKSFQKKLSFKIVDDQSVAASAEHNSDHLLVKINTGLLNSKRLTPDLFRMILCHELGHLFGGAPRRNIPMEWEGPVAPDGKSFMSSEGQSDYYAAIACFKKVATAQDTDATPLTRASKKLKEKCAGKEMCQRIALASLDFLNLVTDFPISLDKTDTDVATELVRDSYPSRQCRLDTMVNAAVCSDSLPLTFDFNDQSLHGCKDAKGSRPRCWYP